MSFRVDGTAGITRLRRPETRFLSTGFDGGPSVGDAAYNLTVPEGWGEEGPRDLRTYAAERLTEVGFDPAPDAPVLLTGVDQRHARVARLDSVVALATVGLSNPAALPVEVSGSMDRRRPVSAAERGDETNPPIGTVNLLVGTTRSLAPGALANLVAVVAEAKATTLLSTAGFPGTTSDAIVVGCAANGAGSRGGEDAEETGAKGSPESGRTPAPFSGAATPVGAAARACVRDAVLASLRSRYADEPIPKSVEAAEYGVITAQRADVLPVDDGT